MCYTPCFLWKDLSVFVFCRLQEYNVETAVALIVDGNASLKIDTQHLKFNLRIGSLYQFIGEMLIHPDNEVNQPLLAYESSSCKQKNKFILSIKLICIFLQAILQARVGRNVDGMDLDLYHQSLQLLKQFQTEQNCGRTL